MGTGSEGQEGWGHTPAAPSHAYSPGWQPCLQGGRLPEVGQSGTWLPGPPGSLGGGLLLQVTVVLGASQDIIPQLKMKYDVDTLDMVFLDHWKDRYLPDMLLLEVSPVSVARSGPAEVGWGAMGWPACIRDTEGRGGLGRGAWASGSIRGRPASVESSRYCPWKRTC